MTYLSWDESRPCVLEWGIFADVNRDTSIGKLGEARPLPTAMENIE
jgi:hypothetical protein